MADIEKPPPLLTRQAWELAAPTVATGIGTVGAAFGPPGLAVAAGVAAAGAGVAAVRGRARAPKQQAKREVKQQQRAARPGRGGLSSRLGLGGLGRTGRAPSGGARTAGAGISTGRGLGLRGALGRLRGGAGKPTSPRSTPTAARSGESSAGGRGRGLLGGLRPLGRGKTGGRNSASRPVGKSRRSTDGGGRTSRGSGGTAGSGRGGGGLASSFRRLLSGGGRSGRGTVSGGRRGGGASTKRAGSARPGGAGRTGAGWRTGGGIRGAAQRAGNLARARRLSRAWGRNATHPHSSSRGGRVGSLRRTLGYLAGRRNPTKLRTATRRLARKPATKKQAGRRGTSPITRQAIDNATKTATGKTRRALGDTMPIGRRKPQINQTGLRRSDAGRLGAAPVSGKNPFAAVIEACGQAAHAYSPENALRVIDSYEGMPELIDAISGMFRQVADKNTDEFYLYPAAAEFARALGAQFQNYKGPCEDARMAFERAHAEDLERIRNPKQHQDRWDIAANRE